ncbi:DNA mismatch repair protein MutS [Halococcus sp. PRR34]|uniref:DNA mismatch repair protein MutS n=1 Tax=Halococcus sp. PRR34 TaxID=3020830 RepID=UPI00235E035F|nr:DNA mismatch repair protein MutS [Halococcus sp. PRR34]
MDAALGPPEGMTASREDLTPMMTQYVELCEAYDDALLLFQMGDFYEAFCGAAETISRELEITLTQREDSTGTYPMAGIPIDNAATYVETLLDAGYRIAVAEQIEDADEATGVVDRAVTRVVTPGTVVEDELLAPGNNYVACLARADAADTAGGAHDTTAEPTADEAAATETDGGTSAKASGNGDVEPSGTTHAVAFVDVSTGEFRATSSDSQGTIQDELDRLAPAEVVLAPEISDGNFDIDGMVTPHDAAAFEPETARERVTSYAPNPEAVFECDAEIRAAGALLDYAEHTQVAEGELGHVTRLTRYDPRERMGLDATALRSLDVFENRAGGDDHTLVAVLDETTCALGRRELDHWLRRPLLDQAVIEARLDAVEELTHGSLVREEARELLREVYDIERLVARVSRGRANARDLRALKTTLDVVPRLREVLSDAESDLLVECREGLDGLDDIRGLIGRAIQAEPPAEITEGGVIAQGFDDDLDDLRSTAREGREWVASLEDRERERTGIDSLSVGHTEVHGYYIEVTNANLDAVPDEYTRRQTLKNSERFYTPELERREDEILGAAERADSREHQLFTDIRDEIAAETDRVQHLADHLATLDVLCTLADIAVENDYARPEFGNDGIAIRDGRHPVVERHAEFVPNDADLCEEPFAIVTGPNMAGKSTYMRQIALIAILAQMGSFVPAQEVRLPIVDRVFTRVGASDDIAGGQSTFMREMSELTDILHGATADSLVLLDEVGRGTSTTDGEAIARAVTEFIHDEIGATTLFATHYHDLTEIAAELDGVQTLQFAADRTDGEVTFLHTVTEGAASASYGVDVARMAGVPDPVVERSRDLVAGTAGRDRPSGDDKRDGHDDGGPADGGHGGEADDSSGRADADSAAETDRDEAAIRAEIVAELRSLRIAETTPVEALVRLDGLKRRLDDENH